MLQVSVYRTVDTPVFEKAAKFELSSAENYRWRFIFFSGCSSMRDCDAYFRANYCRSSNRHCFDQKCRCQDIGNGQYVLYLSQHLQLFIRTTTSEDLDESVYMPRIYICLVFAFQEDGFIRLKLKLITLTSICFLI